MEDPWLAHAKRLHAIAESGLAFAEDPFDVERYEEIARIARTMLAHLANTPLKNIDNLVTPDIKRYVTPMVEVRGAIFKDKKILLVQEKADGLWTLPGGYADVGLSAAENIEKEVFEESGIKVSTERLFSIRHKAKGPYPGDIREFYKLFFLCQLTNSDQEPCSGLETLDVGYFTLEGLPALSTGRTSLRDIEDAFEAIEDAENRVSFD